MKVTAQIKTCKDWCHVCGKRGYEFIEYDYPENAEHGGEDTRFLRICSNCLDLGIKEMWKERKISNEPDRLPSVGEIILSNKDIDKLDLKGFRLKTVLMHNRDLSIFSGMTWEDFKSKYEGYCMGVKNFEKLREIMEGLSK